MHAHRRTSTVLAYTKAITHTHTHTRVKYRINVRKIGRA